MEHTHDFSGRRRVTDQLPITPGASAVHIVLASRKSETAGVQPEVLVPESLGRGGGHKGQIAKAGHANVLFKQ